MILVQVIEEVDTDDMTNSAMPAEKDKMRVGAPCFPDVPKCVNVLAIFGYMCLIFSSAAL
jgi:hypothetical protein